MLKSFCAFVLFTAVLWASPAPTPVHPAPGTTLVRFAKVDEGVYRGSPPRNQADFRFLKEHGVKFIVNLHFLPSLDRKEKAEATRQGLTYIPVFIQASALEPSEKSVDRALAAIRARRHQGVYFHCILGRDRTSLISALYKMYFLGEPQQSAWRNDMLAFGFRCGWTLRGLKTYFYKHPKPPAALLDASGR